MQRNTTFLLKQPPLPATLSLHQQQNTKQQTYLKQLRQSYQKKILSTRRSYNSLSSRPSIDLRETHDTPSLAKLILSRHMQSREHQASLGKIIKEFNLKSPDPKDKFYQYLLLPLSQRTKQHIKTLSFYLKDYIFIHAHPTQLHIPMCYNIVLKQGQNCRESDIVLVETPSRTHDQFKPKGTKVQWNDVVPKESYLCLDKGKYKEIVDRYSNDHQKQISKFICNLELFNDVDTELINRISRAAQIIFLSKGETLYQVQDQADKIYTVFSGKLARKIIIQIQKTNALPLIKQQLLTTNTIYQVLMEFSPPNILGYLQLLQDPPLSTRSQTITSLQTSIVIGISYQFIKELRAASFKWFKKEREEKYPKNYQGLCNQYDEKMRFNKKVKGIVRGVLREEKRGRLKLDGYKVENVKYVRSSSVYKLRKSIF